MQRVSAFHFEFYPIGLINKLVPSKRPLLNSNYNYHLQTICVTYLDLLPATQFPCHQLHFSYVFCRENWRNYSFTGTRIRDAMPQHLKSDPCVFEKFIALLFNLQPIECDHKTCAGCRYVFLLSQILTQKTPTKSHLTSSFKIYWDKKCVNVWKG